MIKNSPESVAILQAAEAGETRITCPYCNDTSEKSMALYTAGHTIRFKCFRDKCNVSGWIPNKDQIILKKQEVGEPINYDKELIDIRNAPNSEIGKPIVRMLRSCVRFGVQYAPEDKRVFIPIFNPIKKRIGAVLRSYTGAFPKVINVNEYNVTPFIGWFVPERKGEVDSLVLVEDPVSALRLWSRNVPAVSLNGTSLGNDALTQIAGAANDVVLSLDKDAAGTAAKHLKRVRLLFNRIRVFTLQKDIKDMNDEELDIYLKGLMT
jgi:hypothetical protein